MATFPTSIPSYLGFTASHTLAVDSHAAQHTQEQADIVALATKLGTGSATPTNQKLLRGNGAGTSTWAQADLTTDVTGVLPVANGGTGTGTSTGSGSVVLSTAPTLASPTLTTPILTTPTIANFTNAQHTHQNATGGGTLSEAALDWSTFSLNMKAAANGGSITPTNTSQDLAANGVTVSFTVAATCNALVSVDLGVNSTTDFEFKPEIRLNGTVAATFTPAATVSSGVSNRTVTRSFTYVVALSAGVNVLSAGVTLSSGTSMGINAGGATIAALVLGTVTA